MWGLFDSILESCEQCRWWRNISVHGLSDSVIKKTHTHTHNRAFPFHSFTENGEWVCALVGGIPTFCTRRRDALCWRDESSELSWQGARPDGGERITPTRFHCCCLQVLLWNSCFWAPELARNTELRSRAATRLFSVVVSTSQWLENSRHHMSV